MTKIATLVSTFLLLSVSSFAQIRTVKGNYCGSVMGNRAGTFGFRVGTVVRIFELNFGQERGNARMIRFDVNKVRVGDEFIIKFDDSNEDSKFIQSITGTGKRRTIARCEID